MTTNRKIYKVQILKNSMENKNRTYFFGGWGNGNEWFVEYGIPYNQETIKKNGNGEGINISMFELISELENKIKKAKEKELTQ